MRISSPYQFYSKHYHENTGNYIPTQYFAQLAINCDISKKTQIHVFNEIQNIVSSYNSTCYENVGNFAKFTF
jgi:hypothetical protein